MAKICPNCQASLPDNTRFCTECGASIPEMVQPVTQQAIPTPQQPAPQSAMQAYGAEYIPPKGSKYDPITTGGYIGIMLLMCIPVIGILLVVIWAFGGCKKINKRNLARASLIMMAIGLVFSLILGIAARAVVGSVIEQEEKETGISFSQLIGKESSENNKNQNESSSVGELDDLASLLGGIAALSGNETNEVTNENIEELEELQQILEGLEGVAGEESEGLEGLLEGAIAANQDAEAANNGWPNSLRKYPGGTAKELASYRTEISGTSLEEMMGWIEDLKKDGYSYKDFYDFGMTEEDMLSMNGWWATDGEIYLSVSYYDSVVTIDHTTELPDLSSYFN